MPTTRHPWRWCLLLAVGLSVGCSSRPTYPKASLENALQSALTADGLHVSAVRLLEHTIAVQLDEPGALASSGEQIGIGPAFDEIARKVLTNLHRVLLSTDAQVEFYVMLLADPQVPGAYLTLVRYMDDVRRANANMLDTPEMFARTVFELSYASDEPLTLEHYLPREIRLEDFLSWQLARRIQQALIEQLEAPGAAVVSHCSGVFQDGEFAFTLDVSPAQQAGTLDEATLRQAFQTATSLIAHVLSNYRFNQFRQVRLIHPLSGRNLILPKARLDIFR